jgi:hypothetical protein
MTTITKKQASLAMVIVAFATIMIAGPLASSIGANQAYAGFPGPFGFHHGKHSHTHQNIFQGCKQRHHSSVLTSGFGSPVGLSGNNVGACLNLNLAGNAAAHDQSGN